METGNQKLQRSRKLLHGNPSSHMCLLRDMLDFGNLGQYIRWTLHTDSTGATG